MSAPEELPLPGSESEARLARLELRDRLLDCTDCDLHKVGSGPIPFSGPTPTEWAIIGEAPGKTEDKRGEPFVGEAGALLRMHLEQVGLDISEAFICNTVSCFPNAEPRPSEVIACRQNKLDQLALADPGYVLLLGRFAVGGFRPDLAQITKSHGRPFKQGGTVFLPTLHPAAAARKREWEEIMAREIGLFHQLLKACRENPQNWLGFVVDDCATCARTLEETGEAGEGVRYDDEGIAYCEKCWPASPYGRKEKAA